MCIFYWLIESLLNVCHPLEVVGGFRAIDWCKSGKLLSYFICQFKKFVCLLYLVLLVEIIKTPDRSLQPGHCQESSQVSSVGGNDDKAKKPPGSCYKTSWQIFWSFTPALRSEWGHAEPESLLQIEIPLLIIILKYNKTWINTLWK